MLRKGTMTKAWCGGMAIWLDHKGVGELQVSSGLLFGRLLNAGEGLECGRRSGGAETSVLVWEVKLLKGPSPLDLSGHSRHCAFSNRQLDLFVSPEHCWMIG